MWWDQMMVYGEIAAKAVGMLATLGGSAWAAMRFVVAPVRSGLRTLTQMSGRIEEHENHLKEIVAQLKPNGGKSLRDSVNQISRLVSMNWHAMRAHIEEHDIAAFHAGPDGGYSWVSRGWTELVSLQRDQATGCGWTATVHPDDRQRVFDAWSDCVADKRPFGLRYRLVRGAVWVDSTAVPVFAADGETIIGWQGQLTKATGMGEDVAPPVRVSV